MLKKKILTFEWLLFGFFILQTIWLTDLSSQTSCAVFALILFAKHLREGFRLNIVLFMITQLIFATVHEFFVRLPTLLLPLLAVLYFPVYRFPKMVGVFFAAYSVLKLRNNIEVSVYYPTTTLTEPVRLTPSKGGWMRFHRFLKARGSRIPGWVFQISLSFLGHLELPVQLQAPITSKAHMTHGKKFPVIILSHGMACNRDMYTTFAREWSSNGYVVFSVDHEEVRDYAYSKNTKEYNNYRHNQVKKRREALSRVVEYISNPDNIQDFFDDGNVELDLTRVSLIGQSFGGAAAVYTVLNEKKINGTCILLDPALDSLPEEMAAKALGIPVLVIRAHSGEGGLRDEKENRQLMNQLVTNNTSHSKQSMYCLFENSSHISQTDLPLHMPRECHLFKMVSDVNDIEDTLVCYSRLTLLYLDTILYEKDPYGMTQSVDIVLKKFNAFVKKSAKKNRLIVEKK